MTKKKQKVKQTLESQKGEYQKLLREVQELERDLDTVS